MLRWLWSGWWMLGAPALAADDELTVTESPTESAEASIFDWYAAWAHAARFDVSIGRLGEHDLGASGLAVQWEWWPTQHLSYGARTWMQAIEVAPSTVALPVANRQATGAAFVVQGATPGPLKVLGGAGVGVAFVSGRLPPSNRWSLRPFPFAGVVEAHGGIVLMARPITVHALAWVHVYSEGPPVYSLSIGGGAAVQPRRPGPAH